MPRPIVNSFHRDARKLHVREVRQHLEHLVKGHPTVGNTVRCYAQPGFLLKRADLTQPRMVWLRPALSSAPLHLFLQISAPVHLFTSAPNCTSTYNSYLRLASASFSHLCLTSASFDRSEKPTFWTCPKAQVLDLP